MNKQDFLDELDKLIENNKDMGESYENGFGWAITLVKDLFQQMDESQKVKIPKFIAGWIESQRGNTLRDALDIDRVPLDVNKWLTNPYSNQELFARAWIHGYEIEKEKLYTVEIPNPNGFFKATCLTKYKNKLKISFVEDKNWKSLKDCQLTESEIKQDFWWAWQWAEIVEEE